MSDRFQENPQSTIEAGYAPCGCSPLGKVWRVSQPYAPGGTKVWTTYSYDARGRTKTVIAADGASTTTYNYLGNQVTVTPPSADASYPKWKTFTQDVFGNVTKVVEPKDGAGNTYTTTYTYDVMSYLTEVSMPRDGVTQTRTFNYIDPATTAASDAAGIAWGQSYGFDGFGNLTTKSVTKGAGPTLSMLADGATNRLYGGGITLQNYDANGNLTVLPNGTVAGYDAENRLASAGGLQFGYDAANQRIWKWAGATDGIRACHEWPPDRSSE